MTEAEERWKTREWHRCTGCGKGQICLRHHVVYRQHVRKEHGDEWDLRNSMWVGTMCRCHANHHHAIRRFTLGMVSPLAVQFARELLGRRRAAAYFKRYYTI